MVFWYLLSTYSRFLYLTLKSREEVKRTRAVQVFYWIACNCNVFYVVVLLSSVLVKASKRPKPGGH